MQYHAATLLHPYNEILDRWNAGGITMIFASIALIRDSAELTCTGCLDKMGASASVTGGATRLRNYRTKWDRSGLKVS